MRIIDVRYKNDPPEFVAEPQPSQTGDSVTIKFTWNQRLQAWPFTTPMTETPVPRTQALRNMT